MTNGHQAAWRIIARLLVYPDESLVTDLAGLEEALAMVQDEEMRAVLAGFGQRLRQEGLAALQAEYVTAFDLNPDTCLEISFHRWGDGRERAAALARLAGLYRRAGYESEARELPDFLPMVLEFLSVCSDEDRQNLADEYGETLAALAGRLKEAQVAHAVLVGAAAAALGR